MMRSQVCYIDRPCPGQGQVAADLGPAMPGGAGVSGAGRPGREGRVLEWGGEGRSGSVAHRIHPAGDFRS